MDWGHIPTTKNNSRVVLISTKAEATWQKLRTYQEEGYWLRFPVIEQFSFLVAGKDTISPIHNLPL